ncbi:MAG: pyridoxal-phosphate dependent enzyme [Deltaproteobacteria bacterium]|nr:pyridoxal-phosphate dependent enzyme [Deltaproteobacteria bacterium]
MRTFDNILEAIGRTPMVRLNKLVPEGAAELYVKCEFLNPGGSIKDRMAVHIVRGALESGELRQGGLIVENTSGNTGAGLALISAVYGCKLILTMPDKMSQEKIDTLRAFGAKVVVTPTNVPADHPDSYYETAKRIAREAPGSFYVNQYHNKANIDAHYRSTGPEIAADMDGNVDALVMGVGTGGTISGVGRYFKENHPQTRIVGVDPVGSIYYDLFKTGRMVQPHVYKVEGIGEDMVCGALDMSVIDDMYQVNDRECFVAARRLAREEGLLVGGSSGAAIAVALEVARKLGPGKRVVAVLPDHGNRYLSKFYSDEWMRVNGFFDEVSEATAGDVVRLRDRAIIWVMRDDTIGEAADHMKTKNISQAPVKDPAGRLVGSVSERALLTALVSGIGPQTPVHKVMDRKMPVLRPETSLAKVSEYLLGGSAVLVGSGDSEGEINGILTRIDLIEHLNAGK